VKSHDTSVPALVAVVAAALLAASPASALRCDTDVVPAATLPYFEVSLERPKSLTTLFSVTNVEADPALVKVVLWTDLAVPTLSFEVYLAGFDVQILNLKDLLLEGRLPVTGSAVSPRSLQSIFPAVVTRGRRRPWLWSMPIQRSVHRSWPACAPSTVSKGRSLVPGAAGS